MCIDNKTVTQARSRSSARAGARETRNDYRIVAAYRLSSHQSSHMPVMIMPWRGMDHVRTHRKQVEATCLHACLAVGQRQTHTSVADAIRKLDDKI